jgi:nucleotide-binding universal stress UspA family protein
LNLEKGHPAYKHIKTEQKEGVFADSILTAAKEIHAHVLVKGSHSRKWLENIVMVSVTERVLFSHQFSLFIVPIKNQVYIE